MIVLLVEDNPVDRTIITNLVKRYASHLLEEDDGDLDIVSCSTAAEALRICSDSPPDIIISDIHLGSDSGLELCREIKRRSSPCCDIPFLATSHEGTVLMAVQSMAAGAFSFYPKPGGSGKGTPEMLESDLKVGFNIARCQRRRIEAVQALRNYHQSFQACR